MCSGRAALLLAALQIITAAVGPLRVAVAAPAAAEREPPAGGRSGGCLAAGNGYLRARIRGALQLDIDWNNAELDCAGEVRPDGSGIRLSFAGPLRGNGRLRLVFGVSAVREGRPGRELPTNLTVMLEGGRIFATRGDDKCTVDELQQQPLGPPGAAGSARAWRISARGFCVDPANDVGGNGRILVSRFDFAGIIRFDGSGGGDGSSSGGSGGSGGSGSGDGSGGSGGSGSGSGR